MTRCEHKTYCAVFWERTALEDDGYRLLTCTQIDKNVKSLRFVHILKQEVKILEFSLSFGWFVLMNDRRQTLKQWKYGALRES